VAAHNEKYFEYSAAYVLGVLDGEELREFEAHLASACPICMQEIANLSEVAGYLPIGLPQSFVAPELKERILFTVRLAQVAKAHFESPEVAGKDVAAGIEDLPLRTPEPAEPERVPSSLAAPRPGRRPWFAFGLAFAILVMLVGFSVYVNSLFTTINHQNEYIATQQTQITSLVSELDRREAILGVLQSRRISIVTMDGLKVNPVGYGKIIWDQSRKIAILQVSHLPAVPAGKDYQLWVIKDQKPISAGVFAVSNNKEEESFFKVQPIDLMDTMGINAFAVTLEPKGGVPQPTGEMYLLGKASVQ
jgi:anti-sigma-K factor RskA